MDNVEAAALAAELGAKIPELDLHRYYPDQAENAVDVFLYEHYKKDEDSVRIIYGIGKGVMEKEVLSYLENKHPGGKHPLVAAVKKDIGSCVVVFEK